MFNNKNDKHIYNIDKVRPCDFFYCEVFFYIYIWAVTFLLLYLALF